jgi:hypothetical protein
MTGRPGAEQRFDEELRHATRSLVTEELPRGVLDPVVSASLGLGGRADGVLRTRRALPGLAGLAGAVGVLLLVTAVALAPGSPGGSGSSAPPSPSPTSAQSPTSRPPMRTTSEIRGDLIKLDYSCGPGLPLSTIEPGPDAIVRESVVCAAPASIGPLQAGVIVSESVSGQVVEVHVKADIVGADTVEARLAISDVLAKAAAVAAQPGSGTAFATWLLETVPSLENDTSVATSIGGLELQLNRSPTGSYLLGLQLSAI